MNFTPEGRVVDSGALEQQIRKHQAGVWHYLRILGCDPEAASDLTQETFLVALRKGLSFEQGARRYLRRTARYLFLDHCRANGRSRWQQDSEAWARAVDHAWENGDGDVDTWLDALARCREKLQGRRARAVALFYGQRLPRSDVAEKLEMKETGVKTLLQRVRADLRDCIDRELRGSSHER